MSVLDQLMPFILGGASGVIATTCIQPIDTVKVRIQISGEKGGSVNPLKVLKEVLADGGVKSLYKGLDSAIFRQVTYGTARLGTFTALEKRYKTSNNVNALPFTVSLQYAITAGVIASCIGNPADLVLIRFQSDSTLPVE